jgi:putative ABC transport system permease protein
MRYVAERPLGFQRENRILVTLRGVPAIQALPAIRAELAKHPRVLGITQAVTNPGNNAAPINLVSIEQADGTMGASQLSHMPIGEDYLKVMGMELTAGRDFSARLLTDVGTSFIVNETLVQRMGWAEPLGKRLQIGREQGRVIGVVRDFHYQSLHHKVEPFVLYQVSNDFTNASPQTRAFVTNYLVVNIAGEAIGETIASIEDVMRRVDPTHPFDFTFLDTALNQHYATEQKLMKLIGAFAAICIFIACLGLFGLAAFTTEQRTREIGTRKVLGASTLQIILLLSRRILVLVLIAAALASVGAYFAMDEWLAGFAYRAQISPFAFLIAAIAAAAVAFVTVALQSFKTARADPVQSLRHV